MTDVDQVVGDDAQPDPALDAGHAFVATTVQAMASLEKTDTTFTAGAPFLRVAEPAFLLESLAAGMTIPEIVRAYPTLTEEAVRGALEELARSKELTTS